MPAARTCSECPRSLEGKGPTAKTCCKEHRQARSRRLARKPPEHLEPLADAVTHHAKDALHDVVKAELAPIVREAISDDVLVAIDKMMRLTPKLIDRLETDLDSHDDQTRGRAMSLLARYTLGNPAVAPKPDGPTGTKIEVHFGAPGSPAAEAEAEELLVCQECDEEKPAGEFREQSKRCNACDDALRQRVLTEFGE